MSMFDVVAYGSMAVIAVLFAVAHVADLAMVRNAAKAGR
jgi:hypothetical protein